MKRKPGRPAGSSPYDQAAIKAEVLEWLERGETLLRYCEQPGKPPRRVIMDWVDQDPVFSAHYRASRDKCHEAMIERCHEISDIEPETPVQATWRKYQIDTKLKILRMVNPARYGEKVGLEHSGGVQITLVTGVPDAEDEDQA